MQPTFGLDLDKKTLQRPDVFPSMSIDIYAAILTKARDRNALKSSVLQGILDDVLEFLRRQLQ